MEITAADVYEFLEASADADDPSFALFTEPVASKTTACEPSAQENGSPSLSHHSTLHGIGADSMLSSRLGSPSLPLPHLQPWNPAVSQLPTGAVLRSTPNRSGARLSNQLLLLQQLQQHQLQQWRRQQQLRQLHEQQRQQQQLLLYQIQPQQPCGC